MKKVFLFMVLLFLMNCSNIEDNMPRYSDLKICSQKSQYLQANGELLDLLMCWRLEYPQSQLMTIEECLKYGGYTIETLPMVLGINSSKNKIDESSLLSNGLYITDNCFTSDAIIYYIFKKYSKKLTTQEKADLMLSFMYVYNDSFDGGLAYSIESTILKEKICEILIQKIMLIKDSSKYKSNKNNIYEYYLHFLKAIKHRNKIGYNSLNTLKSGII